MDVKSGPMVIPPTWQGVVNQATDVKQKLTAGLHQAVNEVKVHAEAYWQDALHFVSGHEAPSAIPLVDDPSPAAPKITVGTRVLIIGDSQTVGPYGKSIDEMARATGATVSTHASWGASPPWFFSGQETYKYWSRDTSGQEATRMKTETPKLNDLLAVERPDVVVVTLGGNMIASGASQADVTLQVSQIGNAVAASGAELIWVGPPKYDPQKRTPEQLEAFYQKLGNIVPEFGTLVDSRPHVQEYAGTDGLHYSGPKGERIAREWASGVFQDIQKLDE
jgi:lysophospholipase L1-like esterase